MSPARSVPHWDSLLRIWSRPLLGSCCRTSGHLGAPDPAAPTQKLFMNLHSCSSRRPSQVFNLCNLLTSALLPNVDTCFSPTQMTYSLSRPWLLGSRVLSVLTVICHQDLPLPKACPAALLQPLSWAAFAGPGASFRACLCRV